MGVSFLLFSNAIKHVPALEANLISTLEPVLNPVWVFLFIGEEPERFALIGGLIVLAGVALNAINGARTPETETSSSYSMTQTPLSELLEKALASRVLIRRAPRICFSTSSTDLAKEILIWSLTFMPERFCSITMRMRPEQTLSLI